MSTNFTPPPVTSYQGQDPQFTPPPLTSYEGQEEGPAGATPEGLPIYTATVTRNYLGEPIPTPQQKRGFFGTLGDYFHGLYQEAEDWAKHGPAASRAMAYIALSGKKARGETLTKDQQDQLDWLEAHDPLRPTSYMNPAMEHPDVAPAATAVAHAIQGDPGAAAADIVFGYAPRGIQAARYAPELARAIPENISLPTARQTGKIVGGVTGATVGHGFGIPGIGGGAVVGAKLGEAGAEMFWRKFGGEAVLERQGALNDLSSNLYGRQFEKLPQARQTEIRGMYDAMGADAAGEHVNALNASADTLYGRKYAGLNPAQQADLASMYESRGSAGAAQYVSDLNGFAEGLGGKYKNLSPDQQAATRALFNRAQTQAEAARPTGPPTAPSTTTPAAVPTAPGMTLTEIMDRELAARRGSQTAPTLGPRIPTWQNQNLGDTVRLGTVEEGPLPQVVRPTRPAPPPRPAPVETPTPTETPTAPAPGSSLSDLVEAMRGIAKRKAGEQPLSEVGRTPPAADEPAAAPRSTAVQSVDTPVPPAADNVYQIINRHPKTTKMAQHLIDNGQELPVDDAGWVELSRGVGEKKPQPPSGASQLEITRKYDLLKRGEPIPAPPSEPFAQKLFDSGVTHKETLDWNPDKWRRVAKEIGEPEPNSDVVKEVRARLEMAGTKVGKIDVADKLSDYMKSQGITPDMAANAPRNVDFFDRQAAAAGLPRTTDAVRMQTIAALRRKYTLKEMQDIRAESRAHP